MDIERRGFLLLTLAAGASLVVGGAAAEAAPAATQPVTTAPSATASLDQELDDLLDDDDKPPPLSPGRVVLVGQVDDYPHDGVFSQYRSAGVFIIRHGRELTALSAVCPHRGCKVLAQPDGTFLCPCHKSRFDAAGHVTKGPAKSDLPRLMMALADDGRLFVSTGMKVAAAASSQPGPRRLAPVMGHRVE